MLHEIVYLLFGKAGSLFHTTNSSIEVNEDIPFFHPHEVVLINQLGRLGFCYMKLELFVENNCTATSLYRSAFVSGLNVYLNQYRQTLVDLENDLLTSTKATLSTIKHRVTYPYQFVLPDLWSLCQSIDEKNANDVTILDLLHYLTTSGKSDLCEALRLIQFHCHNVFFAQVSSLMLHGLLLDMNEEFFIVKRELRGGGGGGGVGENGAGDEDGNEVAEANEDNQLVSSSSAVAVAAVVPTELDDRVDLKCSFHILHHRLPPYILPHVAEKMRFVGESVRMFQHDSHNNTRYESFFAKESYFAQQLDDLANKERFSIREFEHVVEDIRSHVAKELWSLIVEQSNLVSAYEQIRSFHLLGDGQLMLLFIHLAKPILYFPIGRNTEYDVNCALLRAHSTLNPVTSFDLKFTDLDRVKLSLDKLVSPNMTGNGDDPGSKRETSGDNWSRVSIGYEPQWPLHFVFTTSILDRCNKLFKFLLNIKLIEDELHQIWVNLISMRKSSLAKKLPTFFNARACMSFLVENFYYYLQVDVISSNYLKTITAINSTKDYETLIVENEKFISQIMVQSFVEMAPVKNCVTNILEVCHIYHRLIEKISIDDSMDQKHQDVFEKVVRKFNKQSSTLYKTLSSVMGYQPNPYLCQLLMRLDFNGFYSECNGSLIKL